MVNVNWALAPRATAEVESAVTTVQPSLDVRAETTTLASRVPRLTTSTTISLRPPTATEGGAAGAFGIAMGPHAVIAGA
jgi:hypothetical protein